MQNHNDNADPFSSPATALAELYRLRREVLKEDIRTMPFERRRQRAEALKKFAKAEANLLVVLPLV
jgi:hypothetical protein